MTTRPLNLAHLRPPGQYVQATDPTLDEPNLVAAGDWWHQTAAANGPVVAEFYRNSSSTAWIGLARPTDYAKAIYAREMDPSTGQQVWRYAVGGKPIAPTITLPLDVTFADYADVAAVLADPQFAALNASHGSGDPVLSDGLLNAPQPELPDGSSPSVTLTADHDQCLALWVALDYQLTAVSSGGVDVSLSLTRATQDPPGAFVGLNNGDLKLSPYDGTSLAPTTVAGASEYTGEPRRLVVYAEVTDARELVTRAFSGVVGGAAPVFRAENVTSGGYFLPVNELQVFAAQAVTGGVSTGGSLIALHARAASYDANPFGVTLPG